MNPPSASPPGTSPSPGRPRGPLTGTVTGGPTTYTVAVSGMTTPGTVIASIAAGVATDGLGNANSASTSVDKTVTWDATPPTVTINQAAAQLDPTNGATINFTVVFSETVIGFATGDVTLSGTAGATTGTVTGGPTTYNVAVTGMTGSGTVIATIGAGVAADAAGNPNDPSTSTDNTVTRDVTPPTVTIDQAVGQADPTATTPILFTVVFSEPVTGFITGDVAVGGTSGGAKTGTVSGGPTVYTVTVTGMTTSGTVVATIAANKANDLSGNANTASTSTDNTVTWDVTGPTVTINQAVGQLDPTNTSPILFTVVFNEPAVGFVTGDVTFTGTAGGPLTGTVTGGPTTYTVAVSGMTTPGTVIASIAAGVATDGLGNANSASTSVDKTVTWDATPPTVTINQAAAQLDPTNGATINFTVVFSETVIGFATGDVTLSGTAGATTGTVTGGPTTYNVAVTGMTGSGTVIATIGAGVAADAAGNPNDPSTSTDNTVTRDVTPPVATIALQAGSDTGVSNSDLITNAAFLIFDVTFTESVTGLAANDFSNVGTATGCAFVAPVGSGAVYTVRVNGCGQGTVILRLRVSAVTDLAGNANASTDGPAVTIDRTAPTVTINQAVGQADPTNAPPINFTAVFSEPVAGFTTGDVTITGTSGGAKTGAVSGGPSTYSVVVTGMTISGTVIANIAAGVATDVAGNANTASTSVDKTVTWNRATHLAFQQQPSDTLYRSTISPAVRVQILDAGGLVVTESSASVTLVLAPAGPTLGGTLTVAAVNGVATFSGLSVDQIGTYTLDASSGGLVGATSAPFEILPAPLTITADDRTKTYGQTVTFAGTEFSTVGLLGTDAVTSVTLASAGAPAGATVAGGPYAITPSAAVGTGLSNYTIAYVDGALTVTPASAIIVVTGYSVTYDSLPHVATGSATGVFGEDLSADLDLSATSHTAVGASSDPWTFSDPAGDYAAAAGTVATEILPAPLTVTATDRTKTYGQAVTFAGTEFSVSGLLGTDTVTSVTLTSAGAPATATVAGSPYPITPAAAVGTGLSNYTIAYVDGALTVTPAPLTITADDRTKTYGQTVTFAGTEFSTVGLLGTDAVTSVTLASAGAPAGATVAGGPYAITPVRGGRDGLVQLHDRLCRRRPHGDTGVGDHRRDRLLGHL